MRRGHNGTIRRIAGGRIESVDLGADHVAEHEIGSNDLDRRLGIDPAQPAGIERRRVRDASNVRYDRKTGIIVFDYWSTNDSKPRKYPELHPYGDEAFVGAWSSDDFGVWFRRDRQQDADDLWAAFQKQDIAILFGQTFGNPFARAGMALCIISRLPQEILDSIRDQYLDQEALAAAVEKTGIVGRLEAWRDEGKDENARSWWFPPAERSWYALSPSWADDEKTEVQFWLNPRDQQNNNFGWMTVQDLDDWIAGKGKVVEPKLKRGVRA